MLAKSMVVERHPDSNLPGKYIGYWKGDKKGLPEPEDFVDLTWDASERAKVLEYLKKGEAVHFWRGFSWCRFGCRGVSMGSQCISDGEWTWPQGFAHYIEVHGIKPPKEFIQKVLSRV